MHAKLQPIVCHQPEHGGGRWKAHPHQEEAQREEQGVTPTQCAGRGGGAPVQVGLLTREPKEC